MEEFGKIRWFIKNNEVSASLMHWYVKIAIYHNGENLYFPLSVYNDGQKILTFNFYTFEDAIGFTNNVVNKCWTSNEIVEKYQEMFDSFEFKNPNASKEEVEVKKIILNPDEVKKTIVEYFGRDKEYLISCKEKLTVNGDTPDMVFYLIEHLIIDGNKRDISTRLTNGDLMHALDDYAKHYGYELTDFKYIGGIHHVGYYFDENTPYYNGIEMEVKKKDKNKLLRLNRKDSNQLL